MCSFVSEFCEPPVVFPCAPVCFCVVRFAYGLRTGRLWTGTPYACLICVVRRSSGAFSRFSFPPILLCVPPRPPALVIWSRSSFPFVPHPIRTSPSLSLIPHRLKQTLGSNTGLRVSGPGSHRILPAWSELSCSLDVRSPRLESPQCND